MGQAETKKCTNQTSSSSQKVRHEKYARIKHIAIRYYWMLIIPIIVGLVVQSCAGNGETTYSGNVIQIISGCNNTGTQNNNPVDVSSGEVKTTEIPNETSPDSQATDAPPSTSLSVLPETLSAHDILLRAEKYYDLGKYDKVLQCYSEATVLNDADTYNVAHINLGYMSMYGIGCEQDEVLALDYYTAAAKNQKSAVLPYLLAYYLNDLDIENIVETLEAGYRADNDSVAKWFGAYNARSNSIEVCKDDLAEFCTQLTRQEQIDFIKKVCQWEPWEFVDTVNQLDENGMLHIPCQSGVKSVGVTTQPVYALTLVPPPEDVERYLLLDIQFLHVG